MTDTNRLARAMNYAMATFSFADVPGQLTLDEMAEALNHFATAEVKAAVEWHEINSAEDLPKESGYYLWQFRSNGEAKAQHFYPTGNYLGWFVSEYIAWTNLPEPYQPKEEQDVRS